MVVVIKQSGKVIHATRAERRDLSVTQNPEIGYRTTRSFKFLLATLNLHKPFTVVVANAVVDGGVGISEVSWAVDPATIR